VIIGTTAPGSRAVGKRADDEGGVRLGLGLRCGTPKRNLILLVAYLLAALVALGVVRQVVELLALELF
jgi:hypothetical protein